MNDWVQIAKRKGYEPHGISMWVIRHNFNSYSASKALGVTQNSVYRWLHTSQNKLRNSVCALFRVLNGIDLRGMDSTDFL